MVDSNATKEDFLRLQELVLMQQARLHDLSSQAGRTQSALTLQALFIELQRLLQPSLTFEIGAHFATFSQTMSQIGIEAHAFEANPYNHRNFKKRIARRAPNVRYHLLAISDEDGETTLNIRIGLDGNIRRNAGNNSLLERQDSRLAYTQVTVPACRLESFISSNNLGGRSFSAWIDVEGALGKVTAGFGQALSSCLSLIVEVEEKRFWNDQFLVGDVIAYLDSQGMVPVARDFEGPHQYNIVFLRKDVFRDEKVRLALSVYLSVSHVTPLPTPVAET